MLMIYPTTASSEQGGCVPSILPVPERNTVHKRAHFRGAASTARCRVDDHWQREGPGRAAVQGEGGAPGAGSAPAGRQAAAVARQR